MIWMRTCRVVRLFVLVFEGIGELLNPFSGFGKELGSRDQVDGMGVAWECQADGSASGPRPAGAFPSNSQAAGEAALAADLITALKSLHRSTVPSPSNSFLEPAVQKSILPCEWRLAIPASFMWVDFKRQS